MSDERSGKIIVSKDTIVRCDWCETPESNKWYTSKSGGKYCSEGCMAAATASSTYKTGIVSISCSLIIIMPLIVLSIVYPSAPFTPESMGIIMYAFVLLFVGLGALIVSKDARKYRYRKGIYADISTSSLECQYCNYLNPPNVLICQNCDAPLTNAPFSQETTPPWIADDLRLGRFTCPSCHSTYAYYGSMINKEGNLECQNCGKLFPGPEKHAPSPERGKL
jgi:hypothetical protein